MPLCRWHGRTVCFRQHLFRALCLPSGPSPSLSHDAAEAGTSHLRQMRAQQGLMGPRTLVGVFNPLPKYGDSPCAQQVLEEKSGVCRKGRPWVIVTCGLQKHKYPVDLMVLEIRKLLLELQLLAHVNPQRQIFPGKAVNRFSPPQSPRLIPLHTHTHSCIRFSHTSAHRLK